MLFSLLMLAGPGTQAHHSGYCFAESVLACGHQLHRIFFYHEGVYAGLAGRVLPSDEFNASKAWLTLAQRCQLDLALCVGAATRRGVLDAHEAARQQQAANLIPGYRLAGLGEWLDALEQSERTLTFGPGT